MAGAEKQSGREQNGRDAGSIRQRLDSLGEQLAEAKSRHAPAPGPEPQGQGAALGQALRLGIELVAGVAVGGFIGWWLDRFLGTAPAPDGGVSRLGRRRGDHECGAHRQAHAGGRRNR